MLKISVNVLAVAGLAAIAGGAASANEPVCSQPQFPTSSSHVECAFPVGSHEWQVPMGVTSITVDLYGAQGGETFWQATGEWDKDKVFPGGRGGHTKATVPVGPGQRIQVTVGSNRFFDNWLVAGGFNGGGAGGMSAANGGGASDIRVGGYNFSDRIVVAGGGGGSAVPRRYASASRGGDGGGLEGSAGSGGSEAARGGTSRHGGQGGTATYIRGWDGFFGGGGAGNFAGGGGGGGGWYGGGGGAGYDSSGAGGSSYAYSSATATLFESGVNSDEGKALISYAYAP